MYSLSVVLVAEAEADETFISGIVVVVSVTQAIYYNNIINTSNLLLTVTIFEHVS